MAKQKRWQLIGGYGELGDTNWGYDWSRIETDKWFAECQKHIGEIILLAGGGSFGKSWLAQFVSVSIGMLNNKPTLKVRLERIKPRFTYSGENIFEPWLGSWQISAK